MPDFLSSDNVRLSYNVEGSGRPVVLVAGYAAPATTWGLNIDALHGAGYQTISFDRRSHGRSQSPAWGQRVSRHGQDILELINRLELERPVLVGASMGASSCWAAADLAGYRGIGGVVSVDQTPKMVNDEHWSAGFYGLTDDNSGTFFRDGIPETGRGLPLVNSAEGLAALTAKYGDIQFADPDAAETRPLLFDHAMQDWRDTVRRAPVPVLLMAGSGSQLWPTEHTLVGEGNPNVDRIVIDDAGHTVNIDQPGDFNDALISFLRNTTQH